MIELSIVEKTLIEFCFVIFLLITFLCWIRVILYKSIQLQYLTKISMLLGSLSLTSLLIIKWLLTDHLPLSNLYESSLFLSWSLTLVYLFLDKKIDNAWIDAITGPTVMITYTFATLGLPKTMQESTALVPALQSNWLMMHVTMMILSYGTLLFGSLLAVTLLTLSYSTEKFNSFLFTNDQHSQQPYTTLKNTYFTNIDNINNREIIEIVCFNSEKALLINQIDYWSYRIIGIGFPLLTIGILSGAVWANEAWGSYWSWDPKETWALITWIIFAIYLHIRMTKGLNGVVPALVASLGFCVVWMCYLGVNLLGKGLHSYGWFN
uniref:Cytochrome c biogenesis protein CcsA n=1 Tax=Roya anglica TaxID=43943 RepID=A0A024B518_9VIRI|nr:protein involved in cytochrome c biogenesis [Roya anglica]AHZ11158.1 protein involved in cytochrome c biogenesis [Roya anglica]